MAGWTLGIESTAHTLSFGLVNPEGEPFPSKSSIIRPLKGGIHPREAADHHKDVGLQLFKDILETQNLTPQDISAVAYSQGPGIGPCLRIGAGIARTISTSLNVPLIGVNHCVAHIEIGRQQCNTDDPVLLYVSGGNTQIIAKLNGRYRVLGETLDIGIGNMLDKFARTYGIPFPGGPVIEKKAKEWIDANPDCDMTGLELPYAVQGMDLAFSGVMTAACRLVESGQPLEAVCWSLQEHVFAACIEVAERALAHTGKTELLLGGGVACNTRLNQMSSLMAEERGAQSFCPPKMYCVDNGTMIAMLGYVEINSGRTTSMEESEINPLMRTDSTPILWA